MKNFLRYLLQCQSTHNLEHSQKGFTLIELLVAMILAFLVITPLLGFMVNILDTDNKEQAKTNSEQEIQSALDFIAQDMEQAVYIYDADGIYGKTTTDSKGTTSTLIPGILNQLPNPTDTNKVPVLVFWKRYFLSKNQNVTVGSTNTTAGCLVTLPGGNCNQQDYMLYSLVAYYLVKDSNATTWNSTTARIARWEIRDGIRSDSGTQTRSETVNGTTKTVNYLLLPDLGFMPFNLTLQGDLGTKLGSWTKHSTETYTKNPLNFILVDLIDQTTNTQGAPAPSCNTAANEQQVPKYDATNFPDAFKTGSFYACVNSKQYTARVFIRGNALARIKSGAQYNSSQSQFFPTASIQIKGRGFLGVE